MTVAALGGACLVIALAAAVQSSIGFGFALVALPPLALIDPALAPGPFLFASFLLSLLMVWREGGVVPPRTLLIPVLGLVAGTVAAALALSVIPPDHLPRVFAVIILMAIAASASGLRLRVTPASLFAAGGLGGLMGTMAGVHGPPMVLLIQRQPGAYVRATMGTFFIAGYAISLAGLAGVGLFGLEQALIGLALCPGVLAGWLAAPYLIRRLDQERLQPLILLLSAAAAIGLLVAG